MYLSFWPHSSAMTSHLKSSHLVSGESFYFLVSGLVVEGFPAPFNPNFGGGELGTGFLCAALADLGLTL